MFYLIIQYISCGHYIGDSLGWKLNGHEVPGTWEELIAVLYRLLGCLLTSHIHNFFSETLATALLLIWEMRVIKVYKITFGTVLT